MTESETQQGEGASDKTIGEYVAEDYRSAAVLEKYGTDFCCGGQVPLITACREEEAISFSAIKIKSSS